MLIDTTVPLHVKSTLPVILRLRNDIRNTYVHGLAVFGSPLVSSSLLCRLAPIWLSRP